MRRVVVLGAGPAGLAAAFELAGPSGLDDDVEIVVVEGELMSSRSNRLRYLEVVRI